jgi:N-acetylglucosaminyldiphosphoundecaprenol N-acetyl-beta-D-mannosaminyltransferase
VEKRLKEFRPDIIFAGFGMGKQEYWAHDNRNLLNEIGTKLVIGCGGSFDFASGKIRRAPRSVQKIGMEGFWRLANEFKWFRVKRLLLSTRIFYYYYRHHL